MFRPFHLFLCLEHFWPTFLLLNSYSSFTSQDSITFCSIFVKFHSLLERSREVHVERIRQIRRYTYLFLSYKLRKRTAMQKYLSSSDPSLHLFLNIILQQTDVINIFAVSSNYYLIFFKFWEQPFTLSLFPKSNLNSGTFAKIYDEMLNFFIGPYLHLRKIGWA